MPTLKIAPKELGFSIIWIKHIVYILESIVWERYATSKNTKLYFVIVNILSFISALDFPGPVKSLILTATPFLYCLIKAKVRTRFIVAQISAIFYQLTIWIIVKCGPEYLGFYLQEPNQWLIASIDYLAVLLIILVKGECSNGRWKLVVRPIQQGDSEDTEFLRNLRGAKRLAATAISFSFQLFQLGLIFAACAFVHVALEGLLVAVAFILFGQAIPDRWHSDNALICTAITVVTITLLAIVSFPFQVSQFSPFILGFCAVLFFNRLSGWLYGYY
jgi:hypothetical protein